MRVSARGRVTVKMVRVRGILVRVWVRVRVRVRANA